MNHLFARKLTPKEQAMKAKRETRKEVRVSRRNSVLTDNGNGADGNGAECGSTFFDPRHVPRLFVS
jgi:hypothetical protein